MSFLIVSVLGSELQLDQRVRVLSGGRQLQISSAERTDAASYTCTASSEAGATSKVYSLQVYGMYSSANNLLLQNTLIVLPFQLDMMVCAYVSFKIMKRTYHKY